MPQIQLQTLQNHSKNLLEFLNNQRLNGDRYCDVNIYSIDGSLFKAHSSVLAACTPMLINHLQQSDEELNRLELSLLASCDSVSFLLDAVYSGEVTVKQPSDASSLANLALMTGFKELGDALECYHTDNGADKIECIESIISTSSYKSSGLKRKIVGEQGTGRTVVPIKQEKGLFSENDQMQCVGMYVVGDSSNINDEECGNEKFQLHNSKQLQPTNDNISDASKCSKAETSKEKTESDVKKYECVHCCQTFTKKSSLKYHNVRVHNMEEDIPTWKCPSSDCGQILVRKSAYENHLMRHGLKGGLKCKKCKAEFVSSDSYRDHIFTNACQHSGKLIKRNGRLKWERAKGVRLATQMKGEIRKLASQNVEVQDDLIPFADRLPQQNLDAQVKIKESKIRPGYSIVKPMDKSSASTAPTVKKPTKKYTKKPKKQKKNVVVESAVCSIDCTICGKTFKNTKLLSRHYAYIHRITTGNNGHSDMKDVCEVCGDVFQRGHSLVNHQIRVHKFTHLATRAKNRFCEICNKLCIAKSEYENHMRRHGILPMLMCHMCARSFANKSEYHRHTKNKLCQPDANIAKRPVCDVCFHEFATSTSLKRHQIAIHGYSHLSKYFCDVCQSPCKDAADFKKHKIRHGIDEKYSCDICNKKFTLHHSVTRHRAKQHPEYSK